MTKRDPPSLEERIAAIEACETETFTDLIRAAGLDPASAFRFARLQNQRFDDCDLHGFDFTGGYLTGSSFTNALIGDAKFRGARVDAAALATARDWQVQKARVIADLAVAKRESDFVLELTRNQRVLFIGVPLSAQRVLKGALQELALDLTWLDLEPASRLAVPDLFELGDVIVIVDDPRMRLSPPTDLGLSEQQVWTARALAAMLSTYSQTDIPIQLYTAGGKRFGFHLDATKDYEIVDIPTDAHLSAILVPGVWRFLAKHCDLEVAAIELPSPIADERSALYPITRTPRIDERSLSFWIEEARLSAETAQEVRRLVRGHRAAIGRTDHTPDEFRAHADLLHFLARALRGQQSIQANTGLGQIIFALIAEGAICRLQAGELHDATNAMLELRTLTDVYSNRPMVWFRLAQVHAWVRARGMDQSVPWTDDLPEVLEQCARCLVRAERLSARHRQLVATTAEIKHLRQHLPGMRARACLAKLPHLEGIARLPPLLAAFTALREGGEDGREQDRAKWTNLYNAVVVGAFALREARLHNRAVSEQFFASVVSAVQELINAPRARRPKESWKVIAFAWLELGQLDEARHAAARYLEWRQMQRENGPHTFANDGSVSMALDLLTGWARDDTRP